MHTRKYEMLTDTVFLYFFSACFQGLAAILGLLGIFAIFRIQQFGMSIDGARNELYSARGETWPSEVEKFERMTHAEKMSCVAELEKRPFKSKNLPLFRTWLAAEAQIIQLRGAIWKPIGFLAVMLLLNLCALPFSVAIAALAAWCKLSIVIFDIILIACSIVWNLAAIKRVMDSVVS